LDTHPDEDAAEANETLTVQTLQDRSHLYFKLGFYLESATDARRAMDGSPTLLNFEMKQGLVSLLGSALLNEAMKQEGLMDYSKLPECASEDGEVDELPLEYRSVLRLFDESVALNRKSTARMYNRALFLQKCKCKRLAKVAFEEILKIEPLHFQTRHAYGTTVLMEEDYSKAAELLSIALENPEKASADMVYNLGYALFKEKRFQEARLALELVVHKSPSHPAAAQASSLLAMMLVPDSKGGSKTKIKLEVGNYVLVPSSSSTGEPKKTLSKETPPPPPPPRSPLIAPPKSPGRSLTKLASDVLLDEVKRLQQQLSCQDLDAPGIPPKPPARSAPSILRRSSLSEELDVHGVRDSTDDETPNVSGPSSRASSPVHVDELIGDGVGGVVISYEELRCIKGASKVDPRFKEAYLSEQEFKAVFKCNKESFYKLPKWKQCVRRKELDLF
jgi:tetratricopeptide (TPR) repeat protein